MISRKSLSGTFALFRVGTLSVRFDCLYVAYSLINCIMQRCVFYCLQDCTDLMLPHDEIVEQVATILLSFLV